MSDADVPLPFTGERFTPECAREIAYEHWHRYAFVRALAVGKRVLDAACGEGYGSALLATVASEVVGIDIDHATVAHARERYSAVANLRFVQADVVAPNLSEGSFDLVVSFETLEHLMAQEALIAGFARLLKRDGVLVISSPDKAVYSDAAGFRNEFHVRELYRHELLALLRPHFPDVRLYGQKLLFQSTVWDLASSTSDAETWTTGDSGAALERGLRYAPMYFIAVCAKDGEQPPLPSLSTFGDVGESVYSHYNHEIRKNMSAGQRIAELEEALERLRQSVPDASQTVRQRSGRRWWQRYRTSE